MRLFSYFILFSLLFSCSSDTLNASSIIGSWKLTSVLVDPGDGSGTFVDVESDKKIDFLRDETFLSNGNLCFIDATIQNPTVGTFSIKDEMIYPADCENFGQSGMTYKIENGSLTIYYQCIEACAEKYSKIK